MKSFQYFQNIKLGNVEKVDLICGQGWLLEMTGWTEVIGENVLFCMKKVYEQAYKKESEQKNNVEWLFVS